MKINQLLKAYDLARKGMRNSRTSKGDRRRYQAIADLIWASCGCGVPQPGDVRGDRKKVSDLRAYLEVK